VATVTVQNDVPASVTVEANVLETLQIDQEDVTVTIVDSSTEVSISEVGGALVNLADVTGAPAAGQSPVWNSGAALFDFVDVATQAELDVISAAVMSWRLNASVSAGALAIDLGRNPPTGFASTISYVAIGAGLPTCEVKAMTSVNGAVVTVSALRYAHAAGELVVWLPEAQVPVTYWGVKPSTAGETYKIQRAFFEAATNGLTLDGMNKQWLSLEQPLLWPTSGRLRNCNFIATGDFMTLPEVALPANQYMAYSMQGTMVTFTASAATNVITCASNHNIPSDGIPLVLQAQGQTFPGGLVEGRLYYAYNRGATTLQVAESVGGPIVDITSDGAGTLFGEVNSLAKASCDWAYFHGNSVAGLNGAWLNLQQQSRLNDFRLQGFLDTALRLKGQQSEFYDLEIIGGMIGVLLTDGVKFVDFYGGNIEGPTECVVFDGCGSIGFFGMHGEQSPTYYSFKGSGGNSITLSRIRGSFNTAAGVGVKVNVTSAGLVDYTITNWDASGSNAGAKIIDDVNRNYAIAVADLPGAAQGTYYLPALSQVQGLNAPVLGWRAVRSVTAAHTTVMADDLILASAAGAAFAVTLQTAVGIAGKEFTIKRTNSGANAVTVNTTSSQTIDGATSVVLVAQDQSITVRSDGANWKIV
jgi:hypothetical protein